MAPDAMPDQEDPQVDSTPSGAGRPALVYHYCDLKTMLSIIQNRELWLADISKSNDSMELDWAAGLFRAEAEKIIRKHLDWGSTLAPGTEGFDPGAATSYLQSPSFGPGSNDYMRCYALCFSSKADSLGQWRGYADDGRGVALGFDTRLFEEIHRRSGMGAFEYDRVIYDPEESRTRVRSAFRGANPHQPTASLVRQLRECEVQLFQLAPFLKNPTFAEEDERRLSIWIDDTRLATTERVIQEEYGDIVEPRGVRFSARGGDIVPQFRLRLSVRDILRRVVLGPTSSVHRRDVYLLLQSCGMGVDDLEVVRSRSTYR
ncbi:MAG: DUF2971 domain-containing protein [Atopobiaceae bacterium]